jgi:PBP1b-binding outer membrane lipoprotein LpoB
MKYIIPLILSAFFITACDQKTDPNQVDCNKAVSKMTDQEKRSVVNQANLQKPRKEMVTE